LAERVEGGDVAQGARHAYRESARGFQTLSDLRPFQVLLEVVR
jgi:hypothetical protein